MCAAAELLKSFPTAYPQFRIFTYAKNLGGGEDETT